ncbi:hypothetical protein H5410_047565 [Solanum commersonii]|uniref:Uncharacterized protein n=1 Tax=Solanum commersonii TaxID=4109 RepID=A0A9J5XFI2_SOLCO|nr:hypothetical protein H5410_047565 [Solanum commersonii]
MRRKTGEIKEKWITIKYDYILKYYKTCKQQGHSANECFVIHPEVYPKEVEKENDEKDAEELEKAQKGKDKIGETNGGYNIRGKGKQVWNPRPQQIEKTLETTNKFRVFGDSQSGSLAKEEEEKNEEDKINEEGFFEAAKENHKGILDEKNEDSKTLIGSKAKENQANAHSGVGE